MPHKDRDHQHTITLADTALGLIKSHRLPGDPPSFEVWYTYAGRFIPALNDAINVVIAAGKTLSATEIDRIYDRYLGAFRFGDKIDTIGKEVGSEVNRIMELIDTAIGSATRYDEELSGLSEDLARTTDRSSLQAIVEGLVRATRTAADESKDYKSNLEIAQNEIKQLRTNLDAVRFESRTDPLTALGNRKQFDESLNKVITEAARTNSPLTLLMCDVDHFKLVNDTWGHLVGDDVLRLIAQRIRQTLRDQDIAARYGGEEFGIILPNTSLEQAIVISERLRISIMEKELMQRSSGRKLGSVTVSIGAAQWRSGETARELVERADICLYGAKSAGRNSVVW